MRRIIARRGDATDGVVLALACVAQFMVVLDVSIVTVALPPDRCQRLPGRVRRIWIEGVVLGLVHAPCLTG